MCHCGEGRNRSDRPEVSTELATKHRAAVARVVYLVQDRLDFGVAAVELAKTMAIPREGDNERLKRVARYLHGNPAFTKATLFFGVEKRKKQRTSKNNKKSKKQILNQNAQQNHTHPNKKKQKQKTKIRNTQKQRTKKQKKMDKNKKQKTFYNKHARLHA